MTTQTTGEKFRALLKPDNPDYPLQIVGTINAYSAMQAQKIGHKAIYLSGGGVAYASNGLPDLGFTQLRDVLADAQRLTAACDLPLMVDIDTGWGDAASITRAIQSLEKARVAAVHIEDQIDQKRCGHRPNKAIISQQDMLGRIKAAVDARTDESFFIVARTDAIAVEGMHGAIDRASACVEAGADGIFPEAITELSQYQAFSEAVNVPVLANITEFGETPLFNRAELARVGVAMVLYPLSAFRAMSKAAETVYKSILKHGDQTAVVDLMQTREELYQVLDYYQYEQELDDKLASEQNLLPDDQC